MIHKKLEKLRKEHKLSRSKLAEEIGVATLTLTNWESKRSSPKPKDLINLCKFFNITLNDLLGVETWIDSEKNPPKKGEWSYYIARTKGSRIAEPQVWDGERWLCNPKIAEQYMIIPE